MNYKEFFKFGDAIAIVDLETTGFMWEQRKFKNRKWEGFAPQIVSIGAVMVRKGEMAEEFYATVNPGSEHLGDSRIDQALQINKLTRDELISSESAEAVAEKYRQWRAKNKPHRQIAHNMAGFDGLFLRKSPWSCHPARLFDCMPHAAMFLNRIGALPADKDDRVTLETWAAWRAGYARDISWRRDAHNAIEDARTTAICYIETQKILIG